MYQSENQFVYMYLKLYSVELTACSACSNDELEEEYCQKFGYKVKFFCIDEKQTETEEFRACAIQNKSGDSHSSVVIFQLLVGLIGGAAYYGVQARKKKSMSLFDTRKRMSQGNLK